MMIVTSVYSVVDGLFVSNLVGDMALSAVNIVWPIIMIIGAFGFMLGTGGCAVVARTLGEGKKELANCYFSMIIYTVIIPFPSWDYFYRASCPVCRRQRSAHS